MNEEIRACRCTDFWAFHHPDCPAMQTIRRLRAELAECGRGGVMIDNTEQRPLTRAQILETFTRVGLGAYFQPDSIVQYEYERRIENFAREIAALARGASE